MMSETEIAVEVLEVDNSSEAELVNEVGELWQVHNKAKTSLHQTRDELKRIRTDLSERLHAIKCVLVRPGRGGAWSSFLQSQTIPRSTADRLVRRHEKTTMADGKNSANEQISEQT
jgi:ABC-type hemin transport system substrate-binding protein